MNHMAIDQYGTTYHNLGPYPRKALLERLYRKHADKIYRDTKDGTIHVGYVIAKLWLTVYTVQRMERKAQYQRSIVAGPRICYNQTISRQKQEITKMTLKIRIAKINEKNASAKLQSTSKDTSKATWLEQAHTSKRIYSTSKVYTKQAQHSEYIAQCNEGVRGSTRAQEHSAIKRSYRTD